MVGQHLEGVPSVKVVRVYRGERRFHLIFRHQERMSGTPGFRTTFGNLECGGKIIEFLERVFHRNTLLESVTDAGPEFLLDILTDDEDQLGESRADRVKY